MKSSFDFSFLKKIEPRVIKIVLAIFVAIISGGVLGDMLRGNQPNYTYALINAFFISASIGAVIVITQSRGKDSDKKTYREGKSKKRRWK
jgi:uncharacterized membrane protein YeaQ/YmgE (transglycosylase-associated protein family)